MKFSEYQSIPAMNWSKLKAGAKSLRHLKHELTREDDGDTPARAVLRLNHAAVLEPSKVRSDFVVWSEGDRRGKAWTEFKELHAGRQIVKLDEMESALRVARTVREHPAAADVLRGAECEKSIVWTDAETGVKCKARLDIYAPGRHIADLKGDASVGEFAFARRVGQNLYYAQLAWYQMGIEALTSSRLPCLLMPYETNEPHDVAVFDVDEDWLAPGRDLCHRLLREYVTANKTATWPGRYPTRRPLPSPPSYINPNVPDFTVETIED